MREDSRIIVATQAVVLPHPHSVMEDPDRLLNKGYSTLLSRVKDSRVILAPDRGCDVLYPRPSCSVDIVGEWEEGVARARHLAQLLHPLLPLLCSKWVRRVVVLELGIVVFHLDFVLRRYLPAAKHVNGVALVRSLGPLFPL